MMRCDPFPDCTIPSDTKATIIRQLGGEALLNSIVAAGKVSSQPLLGLHSTLYLVLAYDVMDDLKKAKPKLSLNASYTKLREKSDPVCDSLQFVDERDFTFSGNSNEPPGQKQPIASGCYFFLWLSKLAQKNTVRVPIPPTILLGFGANPSIRLNFIEKVQVTTVAAVHEAVWKLLEDESDFAYVREQIIAEIAPGTYSVTETAQVMTLHDDRLLQRVLDPARRTSMCIQKVVSPRKGQFNRLRICLLPTKEQGFIIAPRSNSEAGRSFNPQRSLMNFLPDSVFNQTATTYGIRDFIGLPHHQPIVNFPASEQRNFVETMNAKVEVMEFVLTVLSFAKEAGLPQLNQGKTLVMMRHLRMKLAGLRQWMDNVRGLRGKGHVQGTVSKRLVEESLGGPKCTVYPVANLSLYPEPMGLLRDLRTCIDSELEERKVTSIVADFMQEITGKWYLLDIQKLETAQIRRPKDLLRPKVVFNKCAGDFCRLVSTFTPEQQSQFAQMLLRKGFTNASIYLSDRDPAQSMLWEDHFYKILRKVILDERADTASLSRAGKILKGESPGDWAKTSWGIDTVQVCYLCYLLYTKFEKTLPSLARHRH